MTEVMQKNPAAAGDHREPKRKLGVIEQMPLSERSVQVVEAGLAEYQRIREESTRLAEELSRAENRLHLLEVELNLRDNEINSLRHRCADLERAIDRKTGDYAVLETMLHNVKVQLDAFLPARNEPLPPSNLLPWKPEGQEPAARSSEERARQIASPAGTGHH
jgi:chromosome segregation ATPase